MIGVQTDFQERVLEIESYLEFIKEIDKKSILLLKGNNPAYTHSQTEDLLRTCKASAFLLMYNLIESTISNAIEAIFEELASKNVSFDLCRLEIKKIVLNNLKNNHNNEIVMNINSLAIDIISKTFKKESIFSGNVDAKIIRKVASDYGFMPPSGDGRDLLTIKSSRNDLAHGSKSFSEVGRDFSMESIIEIKDKVIAYLQSMLQNVAGYINNKHYLNN
ncbi:MAE_28990/MAE_18760 family HEPN-like nuclease [Leclercia adecarboxylata]|uniref:MAE_28990/MAE_18760 family HEPN-like nuclease n=1 Tax=Leclercia adecarboxylata TaxID=83655 RepID=UPI0025AFC7A7|nr:MAE_28990/MAE_18760 family HEPN-like nuclease [Leclercia adecarboxylata]WJT04740.1 MAE_28990/MAE_18760 family HEPN-like nuclease [Leclercia adecarboxylata]